MAQRGVHPRRERFGCWICGDLLKDLVTTGCGHSYCKSCINTHWDKEEERGRYSCPHCRQTFTPRPVLEKHTMAAALADQLGGLHLQDAERIERQQRWTRADFLRNHLPQNFTLDPNTAHKHMSLSEENRKVGFESEAQSDSDHPERFTGWCQVLSSEPLRSPCYWEVEVKGIDAAGVAVTDKKIGRKGKSINNRFGYHDKSWMFRCNGFSHDFVANKEKIPLEGHRSYKVGVYHSAGVLKFYRVVDDTMTLLRKVQTKTTEPLYAGLLVYRYSSTAEFCKLE